MIFITLEGNEGSGKTTVANELKKYFENKNLKVLITREPGSSKSNAAETIRSFIMKTSYDSRTEALLYMLSRNFNYLEIKKHSNEYDIIISDRYYHSSYVYQGYIPHMMNGENDFSNEILEVNKLFFQDLKPNITFIMLVKPELGIKRIEIANRIKNKYDNKSSLFHKYVYDGYKDLYKKYKNKENLVFVDSNDNINSVVNEIVIEIEKIIHGNHKKK